MPVPVPPLLMSPYVLSALAEGLLAEQLKLAPAAAVGVCRQASCSGVPAFPHPKIVLALMICLSSALCYPQRLQVLLGSGWALAGLGCRHGEVSCSAHPQNSTTLERLLSGLISWPAGIEGAMLCITSALSHSS